MAFGESTSGDRQIGNLKSAKSDLGWSAILAFPLERWLGEIGQCAKWIFCLTAVKCTA
jgi:hypothetical protein